MKCFRKANLRKAAAVLLSALMVFEAGTPVFAANAVQENRKAVSAENGFSIHAEWAESEFKDGDAYNLYEDADTSNAVKLRISYENNKVQEAGYQPGELVITVKGVGGVGRDHKIHAEVGADADKTSAKTRDWSYTWNRDTDIYTFTNNNEIKPNSVLSGYFDMVWGIESRTSKHGFNQDVRAEMLFADGSTALSEILSFSNRTKCDTFSVGIELQELYSYEGISSGISNPKEYAFYKYVLNTEERMNSRGLSSYRYIIDPDEAGIGSGAIIIGSSETVVTSLSNGTWQVDLPRDNDYNEDYVYVAYPLDKYGDGVIKASLSMEGVFHEGNDEGSTERKQLAYDSLNLSIPSDFHFVDIPGDIYQYWKDTYYDKHIDPDVETEQGGDLPGKKLVDGTTERFYLEGEFFKPHDTSDGSANPKVGSTDNGSVYAFEMVDDFLYILKNDGSFRELGADEYEFNRVVIPGTTSLKNINGISIEENKYPVKVYAFQNGAKADMKASAIVFDGRLAKGEKVVTLPENTTAIAIRIEALDVSIVNFSIPVDVDFHIADTSGLTWKDQDNLTSGRVENTSFVKLYKDETWLNTEFNEDTYIDNSNLCLAQKDLDTYGAYLDREEDYISLYAGKKSDYSAYISMPDIAKDGNTRYTDYTMGAFFSFEEDEDPNQFSLYTILDENLSIKGYETKEDVWDLFKFEGLDLSAYNLANHAEVDVVENYQNSGRTYVGVHFDFEGLDVPQESYVRVTFPAKIKKSFFSSGKSTIIGRCSVLIDEEINEYTLGKVSDNGKWDSDPALSSDIDRDGSADENLAFAADFLSYTYVDSSELQMSKSIKASTSKDYVQLPEVPLTEEGKAYSYELSIRNGASVSKNIVVTDILETGPNSAWKGTFDHVDLSAAEKAGLSGTVWYSAKENPGAVGGSDWSKSLAKEQVRAIAVDFGSSELGKGKAVPIYIHMIAPFSQNLRGKVTENGFSASFTMVDAVSGNETSSGKLDSNLVQTKLSPELKTVILTKVDETDGSRLYGAKFALVNAETNVTVQERNTNVMGQIIFKNIDPNQQYILKELEAPKGYERAEDVRVQFGSDETVRLTIKDPRKEGSIVLYKTNALDDFVKVEGAKYGLYSADGNLLATTLTDINGKAKFEHLAWGDYFIQEIEAPSGYALDEKRYDFTVSKNNADTEISFHIQDEQSGETSVRLVKYEKTARGVQTTNPLSGVVFKLYNVTGGRETPVGTYVTDADGKISVSDLAYGDYQLRETRIPTGYEKVSDVSFTLTPESSEKDLVVYNQRKPGSISVYKHDNLGNIVEGAVFELYDESKLNVLGTYTTDRYGNFEVKNLEWGTYYLKEKSAPEGYTVSDEWVSAKVGRNSLFVDLDITNETKKGTVVLTKSDEIGNIRLPGAEFNLYSTDGKLLKEGLVTDSNGELRVSGLEWGSYYFKETKAPAGYSITDETIRFTVNASNASIVQNILVSNPVDSKMITITKKIFVDDINFDNGDPTFLFEVEGTDVNGKAHTYYRIMKFDKFFVSANTDADGYVSQSVTVSELLAGEYAVSEEDSSRYAVGSVTGSANVVVQKGVAKVTLTGSNDSGSVAFINQKYEHGDFSDNQSVANVIKKQAKLTALKVVWNGEMDVKANSPIDRSLVHATAFYDDGESRELSSSEWSFGDEFSGSIFPAVNGEYEIPVTYTEGSITKSDSFFVTVYGGKTAIIRLEAAVKEFYQEVNLGSSIRPDMFDVTAVYSDGRKETLFTGNINPTTIQSPNYPSQYPDNLTEEDTFWDVSYPGAASLRLVFSDDSSTYNRWDYLNVYNKDGDLAVENLYGSDFAGQEYVIAGDSLKLAMYTDYYYGTNGFSATVYPLDENGNVISKDPDIVLDTAKAPASEGIFPVEISLNPAYFEEDVSTSVNMYATQQEPLLAEGKTFNSFIPNTATSAVFTDDVAPAGTELTDVSARKDMSVVAWMDGTVFKVSSQRNGVKPIANPDSSKMFAQKHAMGDIDVSYLDTSRATTLSGMFASTGYSASAFKITGLESWNLLHVTDMSDMFKKSGYGATSWNVGDLSTWNVSAVKDMSGMFESAANKDTQFVVGDIGKWDVSSVTDMSSMFKEVGGYGNITTMTLDLSDWDVSSVKDFSSIFESFARYATTWSIGDLSLWNTSSAKSFAKMFYYTGGDTGNWDLGDFSTREVTGSDGKKYTAWDVSGVEDMSQMFYYVGGARDDTWVIRGLETWDVSSVKNMRGMFEGVGYYSTAWNAGSLSDWDVSSVEDFSNMFYDVLGAWNSGLTTFEMDFSKWDTSSAINMSGMFRKMGYEASVWSIGDISTKTVTRADGSSYTAWDVSKVENMSYMLSESAYDASTFDIGDIGNWDVSSVETMKRIFYDFAASSDTFELDLSKWNTASLKDASDLFYYAANNATVWNVGDLSTKTITRADGSKYTAWDMSKVENMSNMFYYAAYDAESFDVGDIGNWDTSKVRSMSYMFSNAGYAASEFVLDLSNWNTASVIDMSSMFVQSGLKSTVWDVGNINTHTVKRADGSSYTAWDVSSVEDFGSMFESAGRSEATFELDLSGWDTSSVKSSGMSSVFRSTGRGSTSVKLNLTGWDLGTSYSLYYTFRDCGYSATSFELIGVKDWDTSNITDMSYAFANAGLAATYTLDLSGWNVSKVTSHNNFNQNVDTKVLAPTWP